MRILCVLFILCFSFSSKGQDLSTRALNALDDEELLSLFDDIYSDSIAAEKVARTYLDRARRERDTIKMARGYDRLARIFHHEKNIQFADSVIAISHELHHITYPALGYIIKGYEFHLNGNIVQATENFLKALNISVEQGNVQQQLYVLDYLIYIKSRWGNQAAALKLQRKRHSLIINDSYINEIRKSTRPGAILDLDQLLISDMIESYSSFAYCFYNIKIYDSAQHYISEASKLLNDYQGIHKDYHTLWINEFNMEMAYHQNKYSKTVEIADNLLTDNETNVNLTTKINVYFYRGLALIENNYINQGIKDLALADSLFQLSKPPLNPNQRRLFKELYEYSKIQGDRDNEIKYLNQLLYFDSIAKINYQYFEPNLIRNYETPQLLKEKEKLIDDYRSKRKSANLMNYGLLTLLSMSITGLIYYYLRQQRYNKRFRELMNTENKIGKPKSNSHQQEVPSYLIKEILDRLEEFERNEEFISSMVSLNHLAKSFGTNAKYLSRVINLKKGLNFSQYLNRLRTQYAFERLKSDSKFRMFTIRAIAEDCGFNRAESFSKAFYRNYGIYPSFYIRQLEKKQETQTDISWEISSQELPEES